jgi:hypothetical protein
LLNEPLWSAAGSQARRRFPFDTKAASAEGFRRCRCTHNFISGVQLNPISKPRPVTMRLLTALPLIPSLLLAAHPLLADQIPLQVSEQSFSFQIFDPAEPVGHAFEFFNNGPDTIQVARIAVTEPLQVAKVLSKIPPRQGGQLVVSLGTPRELGDYEGAIEITFKNKELAPMRLTFVGKITPAIDVRPLPAFFVATTRGRTNGASLEIVNQDVEPLQINEIQSASSRYTLNLAALDKGRRYRLELAMRADAKPGRETENITLLTSSKKQPRVLIQANTLVHERVYAFPEAIDLGAINQSDLKSNPGLTNLINQTLMIYQEGGKDFRAEATTDLGALNLGVERSTLNDRSEIHLQVVVTKLAPGPIKGSIRINTNDPEFPQLNVPVTGYIQ